VERLSGQLARAVQPDDLALVWTAARELQRAVGKVERVGEKASPVPAGSEEDEPDDDVDDDPDDDERCPDCLEYWADCDCDDLDDLDDDDDLENDL
jgi:hypothetical protein